MATGGDEDELLRSVALQNAQSILLARQRAEDALLGATRALQARTLELAHSMSLMRATLEATTDAILVTDEAGSVADWNRKFAEMWGLDDAVLDARSEARLLDALARQSTDPAQFARQVTRIRDAARAESFDVLELADGRAIERFSRIQVNDGRAVGRVWSFRDITGHRRAEETARRAAEERRQLLEMERAARTEAERTNAMKDAFLANLSHELRTPLSSIVGWSHVLRRSVPDHAELRRGLEAIERSARMQTQLIEDLLDMNRITSGKVRLDVQPVDPLAVIEAAVETVRPAAEAKGIRVDRLLDPRAGPISGDPNRLQQVVWNLLSNAIKFTAKDGRVQVGLGRVDSLVAISVADTGVGIRPEFLPYVFEPFRQQDGSTARRHAGLGLGLAIVQHLVELHGGTVEARSPGEGRGATFVVYLPPTVARDGDDGLAAHPPGAAAQLDLPPSVLAGVKVLIVDDQPDARDLIERVLRDCGAAVFAAASADEAIAFVEAERPHVLVSDLGMPEVDGFELLRRVRGLGPVRGGALPAIALTAFARSQDRTRALRAGFLAHVTKPVELSELVATVAAVAGRATDSRGD
jgi:PAS domain S-box-containing protein